MQLFSESLLTVNIIEDKLKKECNYIPKYNSIHTLDKKELESFDLKDLSVYYKLRLIVDYISGMTDNFALSLHRTLNG